MRYKSTVLFLAVVLLFSLVGYVRLSTASDGNEFTTYTVEAGDTLWDLALRFAPRSMDLREYVYNVRQINNLKASPTIYPGQQLQLPVVAVAGK